MATAPNKSSFFTSAAASSLPMLLSVWVLISYWAWSHTTQPISRQQPGRGGREVVTSPGRNDRPSLQAPKPGYNNVTMLVVAWHSLSLVSPPSLCSVACCFLALLQAARVHHYWGVWGTGYTTPHHVECCIIFYYRVRHHLLLINVRTFIVFIALRFMTLHTTNQNEKKSIWLWLISLPLHPSIM